MGIEGHSQSTRTEGVGTFDDVCQDSLMPAMNPIEITDAEDGTTGQIVVS